MPPDSCSWAMLSSRWVNYPENAILDLSSKKICQSSPRWATAQQIAEKQVTTEGAFFTIFHNSTIECHVTAPCPGELKWKMPPRVYSSCWRRRNGRGIVINATGVTTCWQQVSTWHVAAGNAAYLFTKPALGSCNNQQEFLPRKAAGVFISLPRYVHSTTAAEFSTRTSNWVPL